MANIENNDLQLAAEDVDQVKGGPLTGYMKISDIKGEAVRATPSVSISHGGPGGAGKVKI